MFFGFVCKFWKGHDGKIKEKSMQKHIFLRVYFHTCKIHALVMFANFGKDMMAKLIGKHAKTHI